MVLCNLEISSIRADIFDLLTDAPNIELLFGKQLLHKSISNSSNSNAGGFSSSSILLDSSDVVPSLGDGANTLDTISFSGAALLIFVDIYKKSKHARDSTESQVLVKSMAYCQRLLNLGFVGTS